MTEIRSASIFTDKDVEPYEVGDDLSLMIIVPMARREDKPVYLNSTLQHLVK